MTVIKEQVFNKQLDSVHCGDGCKIHRPYDNVCIWHKDLNHVSYTCDKSGPTTDESHSNWRRPSMQALCGFGPFSHCQPFWCWWATIQMFRQTLNCRVLFSLVANSLADCRRSGLSSEGPQTRWIASVKQIGCLPLKCCGVLRQYKPVEYPPQSWTWWFCTLYSDASNTQNMYWYLLTTGVQDLWQ